MTILNEKYTLHILCEKAILLFEKQTSKLASQLRDDIENKTDDISQYQTLFERKLTLECLRDEQSVEYISERLFDSNNPDYKFICYDTFVSDFCDSIIYDQNTEMTYKTITKDTMSNMS